MEDLGKRQEKEVTKERQQITEYFYYYYFTEKISKVNFNLQVVWDQTEFLVWMLSLSAP